jgi:peroxiredoxin Q/BCP
VRKLAFPILAACLAVALSLSTARAADEVMPSAGQSAPTFTLPSQDGTQISLDSFRGKWVVLYFYPKDMTQGCTIEAHNFQRDLSKFEAENAVILGVSVDTPDSHKQFCTKEGLTFRLLADPEHKVVDQYGSLGHFGTFTIANRNTFLIDPHGKIVKVWTKVDPSHHSEEVLAELQQQEAKK